MRRIYLDYNASTPIDPAVAAAMSPFLTDSCGNPSSGHWAAITAKAALEHARRQIAALLGCASDEIVFTSGGSEANYLAPWGSLAVSAPLAAELPKSFLVPRAHTTQSSRGGRHLLSGSGLNWTQ